MAEQHRTSALYKKDSKGNVRVWQGVISVDNSNVATISSLSGLEGGKLTGIPVVVKPMNVGRSNETTSYEQAVKEMASKLNKKIREGYVTDISEFQQTGVMKALEFEKAKHRLPNIIIVQPKLDGIRCKVIKTDTGVVLMSKSNKEFGSWLHRLPWVSVMSRELEVGEEIDGEMYIHGWDLQDIKACITKDSRTRTGKQIRGIIDENCTDLLEFWAFDLPKQPDTEIGSEMRLMELDARFSMYEDHNLFVTHWREINKEDIYAVNTEYVAAGFEGTMARSPAGLYAFGDRSPDLQKFKLFHDDEFRIIAVSLDRLGHGQFVCMSHAGHEFEVRPKGTAEFREYIAAHPDAFINKLLTVRYQMLLPGTLIPQFARGIAVRDYE